MKGTPLELRGQLLSLRPHGSRRWRPDSWTFRGCRLTDHYHKVYLSFLTTGPLTRQRINILTHFYITHLAAAKGAS